MENDTAKENYCEFTERFTGLIRQPTVMFLVSLSAQRKCCHCPCYNPSPLPQEFQYFKEIKEGKYPMMRHFYSEETGLFDENNASVHRAWWLNERFNEYENDVNPMQWPSH